MSLGEHLSLKGGVYGSIPGSPPWKKTGDRQEGNSREVTGRKGTAGR